MSAPSAAASAGPAWFGAVAAAIAADFPDADIEPALDCGSMPGHALAALRRGLTTIRYDGPSFDAIADIAQQGGAVVLRDRPAALDIGQEPAPNDRAAVTDACRRWLRATE